MKEVFPKLPAQTEETYEVVKGKSFTEEEIPEYGLSLNLQSQHKNIKKFRKIEKKGKKVLIAMDGENEKRLSIIC